MIKVLIVEDDPMVVKLNKYYLSQVEGFELKAVASCVDEALNVLDSEEIELILLDVFLPDMNGLDLLSKIRKMDKSVDVIVVSAAHDSQSIKKALQYGAVDYLIKPFEFERFNAALSAYRKKENLIKEQRALSQEELDKHILYKEQVADLVELPKGLDRNTLKVVWEDVLKLKGKAFSTEELAIETGISRVSMRKYLFFLNEIGALKKEIIYGAVGRPIYKYMAKLDNSIIKLYL